MYILDVIPIVKIPKNISQVLSYFSKDPILTGSLVSVPLGRAKVNALVVASYPVDEEKISIKKSGFRMKNIENVISKEPVLSGAQLDLFKWFLKFYASPIGLSAKTFIPNYLTKKKTGVKIPQAQNSPSKTVSSKKDILAVGENRDDFYEKEIKKMLSKNRQILFLVPDVFLLKYYQKRFEKLDPAVLSTQLTPKKYFDGWLKVRSGESKLIISTRTGAFLNFSDLGLVILDKEQDSFYKSRDMMPYYHTRDIALKLAELSSADIILGSSTPSIEMYFLAQKGKIKLKSNLGVQPLSKPVLIDMRNEMHGGNYSILSYQLQQKLENIIKKNDKAIFFISRRGSETFVFCRDCGYIEKCPNCETSLIHHTETRSLLVCHYCGFKKDIQLKCPSCQGHKIKYFGAGTKKAEEEILKLWPNAKIGVLDSDIAPTQKKQEEILNKFKEGKINILIGTQLLFKKYDIPKVSLVSILSMDNLFYLPDFKSGERIFQIARQVSFFCKKNSDFLLQTYTPDHPVLETIRKMDYESFYKSEIESRKAFSYPPFSQIIKLIFKHKNRYASETEAERLTEKIINLNLKNIQVLGPAPAYIPKIRNNYIWQIILKLNSKKEAEKEKNLLIKNIPEGWTIDVNPESLL